MQFNQANNNVGNVTTVYPDGMTCYADAWKKVINESCADEHKYDELRWAAICTVMTELLVLHDDPNAVMPMGVMEVKSRAD